LNFKIKKLNSEKQFLKFNTIQTYSRDPSEILTQVKIVPVKTAEKKY